MLERTQEEAEEGNFSKQSAFLCITALVRFVFHDTMKKRSKAYQEKVKQLARARETQESEREETQEASGDARSEAGTEGGSG